MANMRELTSGCVAVWSCPLLKSDETILRYPSVLSKEEEQRANRFHFDKHRKRFIHAHNALRIILSRYLETDPVQIRFAANEFGKPIIASKHAKSIEFNLTHSNNMALVAVTANQAVGIDIEYQRRKQPDTMALAKRFFSANEYEALSQLPAPQQLSGFFNAWTRKEAFIKAIGQGLSYPLDNFDVTLAPDEPAQLLRIGEDTAPQEKWFIHAFEPTEDYVGAVVVEGAVETVEYHHHDQ